MAKKGLGKGLGALLSEAEDEVAPVEETDSPSVASEICIDVALLEPNPQQPRTEFDEGALKELSLSIREHGIIQPILVEKNDKGGYYIIAGERRTRAARLAGLKEVPVRIQKFSEQKKLEVALIENIQRENLNAIEEAMAYKNIMEMGNLSQDDVAIRVGKNRSTVANALRLLKLPSDMQANLANGIISAGHARALLSVIDLSSQRNLFEKIVEESLSVRAAELYATEFNGKAKLSQSRKDTKKNVKRDPDLINIEQQFIEKLGTKVSIKGDFEKGVVQIDYYSKDDLNRLYDIMFSN